MTGMAVAAGLAGLALSGPLDLRSLAARAYTCTVPMKLEQLLKGGPSWPAAPSNAREALGTVGDRLTDLDTEAFVVVQDGQIVYEDYARCHGPFAPHFAASAAKGLVGGLLTAVALDSGWVDLDDLAATHLPLLEDREVAGSLTLRHLGTQASGFDEATVEYRSGSKLPGWKGRFWGPPEERWDVALTETPVRFAPGTDYLYSNPGIAILGYALASAAAENTTASLRDVLDTTVMSPLGIPGDEWSISDGRSYPADEVRRYRIGGGASFSARALIAIGELLRQEGRLDGEEVLSEGSLAAVVSYSGTPPLNTLNGNPAPGIGWHTNAAGTFASLPEDAFLAAGAQHQVLLVVPSRDLVVIRNGGSLGGPGWGPGYWSTLEAEIFAPVMNALDGG